MPPLIAQPARIGLIGDYDPTVTAHRAIPLALALAREIRALAIEWDWVPTPALDAASPHPLDGLSGVWCVPASPYRSTNGALRAIRFAREHRVPFLGTCGGFQHALLEYARSVWGEPDAAHAELDPGAERPLITPLTCALVERRETVQLVPGSRLAALYGRADADEGYHCSYGLDPARAHRLEHGPLRVAARNSAGEVRAIELDGHPFFVATLFQPERAALTGTSHPLIEGFAAAVADSVPLP